MKPTRQYLVLLEVGTDNLEEVDRTLPDHLASLDFPESWKVLNVESLTRIINTAEAAKR